MPLIRLINFKEGGSRHVFLKWLYTIDKPQYWGEIFKDIKRNNINRQSKRRFNNNSK